MLLLGYDVQRLLPLRRSGDYKIRISKAERTRLEGAINDIGVALTAADWSERSACRPLEILFVDRKDIIRQGNNLRARQTVRRASDL